MSYSRFLLVIYIAVYICQSRSPSLSLPPLILLVTSSFFLHLWFYFSFVSSFVPFFLNSTYMQYHIRLSVSNLLHSVWQCLGPSMLLQMALFCCCSFFFFFCPHNILLLIYTTSCLSISLLKDIILFWLSYFCKVSISKYVGDFLFIYFSFFFFFAMQNPITQIFQKQLFETFQSLTSIYIFSCIPCFPHMLILWINYLS